MLKKVLYNTTVVIDKNIHEEWKQWMIRTHIPKVMATGCFIEYKISLILGNNPDEGVNYAIQYISPSMETFLTYRDRFAKAIQMEHQNRFKDRAASFRTVMEVQNEGYLTKT